MPRHPTYLRGQITMSEAAANLKTAAALIEMSKEAMVRDDIAGYRVEVMELVRLAGSCQGTAATIEIRESVRNPAA